MEAESSRWQRIEPALDALLTAAPSSRDRLLEELTREDPDLRDELRSLLVAHAAAEHFLETPATALAAPFLLGDPDDWPAESPGQLVGRYRLIEPIGRGGMGTVWLAERADGQFEQRVAVKLIKRGMDTDEILTRFHRERQIMARLEHANIARLLDAGAADDGRPYFVMEYVDGTSITRYCEEHRLNVDERLALLERVARTVHYAHGRLVVHRDLKPSNILVTTDGHVKLLDFGIAKLLEEDPGDVTATGWSRPFTPEYATPEQIAGDAMTTASDVYQLGLVCYELVTGQRPHSFNHLDRRQARDTIQHGEVARPSSLDKRLGADLDAIVLTAMRKEPERRYASADALADDLRRYREGRPIAVRASDAGYRIKTFVRRNRGRIAGVVVLAVAAVALGTSYTIRLRAERDRALREAVKSSRTADFFGEFFEGWNPDAQHAGRVTSSDLLEEAVRRVQREYQGEPEIEAAMLSLAASFFTGMGNYDRADSLSSRALSTQRKLFAGDNSDLAATLVRRGRLQRIVGRYADAERSLAEALRMYRALFGGRHLEALRTESEQATLFIAVDRPKDAETLLRHVLASYPDTSSAAMAFRAEAESNLGYSLFQQARYREALDLLQPALDVQRRLHGNVHINTLYTMRALASTLRDIGELDRAESLYRESVSVAELLFGPDHPQTQMSEYVLLLHLHRADKLAEAEQLGRDRLPRWEQNHGVHDPGTVAWRGRLAGVLLDRGELAEAETMLRSTLADFRALFPNGHQDEMDWANRLAYLTALRGAPDAEAMYQTAIALRARKPADQPDYVTDGIHYLAWTMVRRGDAVAGRKLYEVAQDLYRRLLPANHPYIAFVDRDLAASVAASK